MFTCLFITTFSSRSVRSLVKHVVSSWHTTFGRTFGTRSVSLPKPSASVKCNNLDIQPISNLHLDTTDIYLCSIAIGPEQGCSQFDCDGCHQMTSTYTCAVDGTCRAFVVVSLFVNANWVRHFLLSFLTPSAGFPIGALSPIFALKSPHTRTMSCFGIAIIPHEQGISSRRES